MSKVCIFGGTAEGRELAEYCQQLQIPALVSVVSAYGSRLLPAASCLRIQEGPLPADRMTALLAKENPALVLDATHPYASVVTATLSQVCHELQIPYRRVLRDQQQGEYENDITTVKDVAEAVSFLNDKTGTVFVTTGSKELAAFTKMDLYEERIYARVLPDSKVMAMCENYGIRGSHLIGMQGPFSVELNIAMLQQTKARWLVTKESGNRGGFQEKMEAAIACHIPVVVIGRPLTETGITLAEAKQLLQPFGLKQKRRLHLIGMGMGGGQQLTQEAIQALTSCQAVLGARRMLADVEAWTIGKTRAFLYLEHEILAWLNEHSEYGVVGIVYSGDTGFYSGSSSLLRALEEHKQSQQFAVTVYPGISTVSALCARLQTPWEDVCLKSIHGRSEDVPAILAQQERVFFLLGGINPLANLCKTLVTQGYGDVWIQAGERLGYPDEVIRTGSAAELQQVESDSLTAVLIERKRKGNKDDEG